MIRIPRYRGTEGNEITDKFAKGLTSIHRICGILERVVKMAIMDD
jgi:hypothetical protein